NETLYNLGAQGPDILFYYKPWSPIGGSIREAGERMHHHATARFFTDAIEILNKSTGKYYEELLVYMLGFLCHYYCDKTIHPYVYSMIGKGCYKFEGGRVHLSHYEIEATIDTRLWLKEKGVQATKVNNAIMLDVKYFPDVAANYLSQYLYKTQSKIISDYEIRTAIKNMIRILGILYDPRNKKKKIINRLPLPRKCYIENGFAEADVLNENKRAWNHPGDDKNQLKLSVEELLQKAVDRCTEVADVICAYLENGTETDFARLIPDQDYCTQKELGDVEQNPEIPK
ncbi:MAG: zinc dependent phospholipase C family protein, partial [Clostridia bacterium]|nr:zinc dependent phospholipase C family protein [Clostridia bacterium]